MLRVLNVISDSNIGGAGRVLINYLKNRDTRRVETVAALPRNSLLTGELRGLGVGVEIHEIDGLAERSFSVSGVKNLTGLIKKIKPDIVHTHASMSARVAARLRGAKVVYTRHSVFPGRPAHFKFPRKQIVGCVNNLTADGVIAVSPAAMENVVDTGVKREKIRVVYNGADKLLALSKEEKAAVRQEYGIGPGDFLCGMFARLTPVKGHEYVLEAARILADVSHVKFIIAGAGELEEQIKQKIEKPGNTVFAGFIKQPARLIAAVDVLLNASYGTEATSMALLEGMSVGVPAVVSDYGGNPYIIKDNVNGLVIPQKNANAISEAILKLSDREMYNAMSENAVRIFDENFTAAAMARSIEDFYYDIVSGR